MSKENILGGHYTIARVNSLIYGTDNKATVATGKYTRPIMKLATVLAYVEAEGDSAF